MSKLNVAVVGAGHLGRIHARIANAQPDTELIAVADPFESARQKAAEETGVSTVSDYQTLLENTSHNLDAVFVATPTTTHHAVVSHFLAAGVPVFVEKPIAATYEEASDLAEQAAAANVVLQVGHVERFNPALTAVASRLDSPKYITAERLSGYPGRSLDIGVVLDLMIHDIDVVLSLVRSELREVAALGLSVLGRYEDMAQARLTFANGCVVNLTASRVSYECRRAMQVFTANGFASLDFATGKATFVQPNAGVVEQTIDAPKLTAEALAGVQKHLFTEHLVQEEIATEPVNAIEEEQRDFYHAIRTGEAPRVSGNAGRDALAVAQRILKAIDAHSWDGDMSQPARVGPFATPAAEQLRPAA